jgi:hypothetical protein
MEIKEIVSYFLNSDSNILDVSFRTIEDDDDVLRTDNIDYSIVGDYGFELQTESFDFFNDDFELKVFLELAHPIRLTNKDWIQMHRPVQRDV